MKRYRIAASLLSAARRSPRAARRAAGWDAVDKVFGQAGKDMPGEVRRYGWPRSDLHVTIGGVAVEPALALGSWAAFKKTGAGDEAVDDGRPRSARPRGGPGDRRT